MRPTKPFLLILGFLLLVAGVRAAQDAPTKRKPAPIAPGAAPPKWDERILNKFFPDARKQLGDPSTRFATNNRPTVGPAAGGTSGAGAAASNRPAGGFVWSGLISAETLENEVKATTTAVADDVASLQKFKSSGYERTRTNASVLALLFRVIGEYDGDVRWQDEAAGLAYESSKTAANCKSATDLAHKDSKALHATLADLIRGDSVAVKAPDDRAEWGELVNVAPLMNRLDLAREERIQAWSSDGGEFKANREKLIREAELMAAIAEVIKHKSFAEKHKDDTPKFATYADEFKAHCLEMAAGAKESDLGRVQTAVGAALQMCDQCHGDFQ